MRRSNLLGAVAGVAVLAVLGPAIAANDAKQAADKPKRGGALTYTIGGNPPSLDPHRDATFATLQPVAPFYSKIIRIDPYNPSDPGAFVCDLCTEMPKAENDGKRYTFKLRNDVKFHDGTKLTSADVLASMNKIMFPPEGVISARKHYFEMVDKISAPDGETIVFDLKYAASGFLPALALPTNAVMPKAKLDADIHWFEQHVLGSGPFKLTEYQPGAFIAGERNEDYYFEGKPYLDSFRAILAPKQATRVNAIRSDRAAIEFRGFTPKARDDLVAALGDKITVQESDWNCEIMLLPNTRRKPLDDVRVRRALTLALDRWGGAEYLSKIALVKTPGTVVFPGSPLAPSREELEKLAGYWPDIEKSRAEARRLLKEAGVQTPLKLTLNNRAVDQPYKIVGTWVVDQLRQVGIDAEQQVVPSGPFWENLRGANFDITLDPTCAANVNVPLDIARFQSEDKSSGNYGGYTDRELDGIVDEVGRSSDEAEQKKLLRRFETVLLDEKSYSAHLFWWNRIIPYRSYVKGWKISPSHYINQDLATIWIDESLK